MMRKIIITIGWYALVRFCLFLFLGFAVGLMNPGNMQNGAKGAAAFQLEYGAFISMLLLIGIIVAACVGKLPYITEK